ncbi:MAG: hypothetical protein IKX53_03215 [Bacteroidales bacterium]|nr:hypothetical protein [Bacteroidales bacterium]
MKRLFVLFAFLLVSCAVFAQDEKPQSEGTLLIVPRLEVEPAYSFAERQWSANAGLSSVYSYFDGNLGEHFSFSVANHWALFSDSFDDTKNLYRNTWRADAANWVDWAYITASFGNFSVSLGKDYIHFGTYEIDAYDHDSHWQLNSSLWNNYQVYQWGGSFGWTSDDESTALKLEMRSDPLMEKPFAGPGLEDYAYTLYGSHEADEVSLMGSVSHCSLGWIGAMGLNLSLSDELSLGADGYLADNYFAASLKLTAALAEKADLFIKGGMDIGENELILEGRRLYCGLGGYWYPLRDSRDLRLHALYAYDSFDQSIGFSIGLTYALNLQLF